MLADADIALAHLGEATVVGRGLGAYVALMLAGARPQLVRGAVLCDGPGLWGGATGPTSTSFHSVDPPYDAPDPNALIDLSRDLRPPDYAALFVRLALEHSGLADPITVAAIVRPPWLAPRSVRRGRRRRRPRADADLARFTSHVAADLVRPGDAATGDSAVRWALADVGRERDQFVAGLGRDGRVARWPRRPRAVRRGDGGFEVGQGTGVDDDLLHARHVARR